MLRFAANLTTLFTELPIHDRFCAARAAGFTGVEVLFPYDLAAPPLAQAAAAQNLTFVLINAPPPNWAGGPRGWAATPGGERRFRSDFDRCLRFAEVLRVRHLHLMAGAASGEQARDTMIANLIWAAERAPHISLTIEPLNGTDVPGYFLDDFDLAAGIIETVNRPNVGLQFDSYHAHQITGDVLGTWDRHAALVRHIQISGAPGRREPSVGAVDHMAFLRRVKTSGYDGWVSAEYNPSLTTETSLDWLGPAMALR